MRIIFQLLYWYAEIQRLVPAFLNNIKTLINHLWLRTRKLILKQHISRPRLTNRVQDQFLQFQALGNHYISLHLGYVKTRYSVKVPVLSRGNISSRLAWTQVHLNWLQEWVLVLLTDEPRFGFYLNTRKGPGSAERLLWSTM